MNTQQQIQAFITQFQTEADAQYKVNLQAAAPTGQAVYGVRVPQLRQMAKTWHKAHADIEHSQLLALVEGLWSGTSREEKHLALELLRCYKRQVLLLHWDHFDRWRADLDGWELTDALGVYVFGRWLLADPIDRLPYLQLLIHEDHLWSRRLAIVATVWLNRGQDGLSFPNLTLDLLDRVKTERTPIITKAVSWALRELIKKHPDRVADYIEKNDGVLAANVKREVRNKLRSGRKSGK